MRVNLWLCARNSRHSGAVAAQHVGNTSDGHKHCKTVQQYQATVVYHMHAVCVQAALAEPAAQGEAAVDAGALVTAQADAATLDFLTSVAHMLADAKAEVGICCLKRVGLC